VLLERRDTRIWVRWRDKSAGCGKRETAIDEHKRREIRAIKPREATEYEIAGSKAKLQK